MKKFLWVLALLPSFVQADTVNFGATITAASNSGQPVAAVLYQADGAGNLVQVIGASISVSRPAAPNGALLGVSYIPASTTVETVTTAGMAVNISTVAGVNTGPFRVYLSMRDSSAGIYWDYGSSATVPAVAQMGHFVGASLTAQIDDGLAEGTILYLQPTGGATTTVHLTVSKPK